MRRLVIAVVVPVLVLSSGTPLAAEQPEPRTRTADLVAEVEALHHDRTGLLARIAALADEAATAHAAAVLARQRESAALDAVATARRALVDHAVDAFVHAGAHGEAARHRAGVFAAAVADVDRSVVDAVGAAVAGARSERATAEAADGRARAATGELAAARAALEATIAVHEARTEAALAEEARNALARRLAEEEQARRALAAAAGDAPSGSFAVLAGTPTGESGGAAPASGYSDRQRDRITRATAAQAALMAAHPFGPVSGLPAGAVATGTVVEGMASWYGPGFDGRPTASGALYDQEGWTVASKELPLGTTLLLTRGDRSALVLVNDRGPYVAGRVLDLSHAVARHLGTIGAGVAPVRAQVVTLG